MPALAQPTQVIDPTLDRYIPKIERVDNQNYNELATRAFERFRKSAFLKFKYGLLDADLELEKLSKLVPGWDSYGAATPSIDAIGASKRILAQLAGDLILPTSIVPSASGGISIYFIEEERTAYIENYNDGGQALVTYARTGAVDVLEIGSDIQAVDVAGRISQYLG